MLHLSERARRFAGIFGPLLLVLVVLSSDFGGAEFALAFAFDEVIVGLGTNVYACARALSHRAGEVANEAMRLLARRKIVRTLEITIDQAGRLHIRL